MNTEIALDIWNSEDYKYINSFLADYYQYTKKNTIQYNGSSMKISTIIDQLLSAMKPMKSIKSSLVSFYGFFYRGDNNSLLSKKSYIKETFISVSTDKDQALTYSSKNCCLYQITIDDHVSCLKTGIENEILIEPQSYWKYISTIKQNDIDIMNIIILPSDKAPANTFTYSQLVFDNIIQLQNSIISEPSSTHHPLPQLQPQNHKMLITVDNLSEFIDEFNIDEQESYSYDDFLYDIKHLPDIEYDIHDINNLWNRYTQIVSKKGGNRYRKKYKNTKKYRPKRK
jgi:hypothetical protein